MSHDYETFATAARTRLNGHIYQNICKLMTELRKNAEHFTEWQDELWSCGSIETVQENQYRILPSSYAPGFDSTVRVVEMTEIDQDDNDVEEYTETSYGVFAQWLWNRMTSEEQAAYWRSSAMAEDFEAYNSDHQEILFQDKDARPDTVSGLLPYLKEQPSWNPYYTLLEEGEDPELTNCEVYEHWAVSNDGKRDLESVGERVVEIMGLNIWCRTCTGQSLWYDACMQQLGQRYLDQ
jgi:hypothetical protein